MKPIDIDMVKGKDGIERPQVTRALFILKFGGELTHAGVG